MKFFMKGVLFLSRLAFICNVLFVFGVLLQRLPDFIRIDDVKSIIGVLGWFVAPFLSIAVNISYVFLLFRKKLQFLPVWLTVTNFLFLLAEITVHLMLPSV
jgi:hypothetical protein